MVSLIFTYKLFFLHDENALSGISPHNTLHYHPNAKIEKKKKKKKKKKKRKTPPRSTLSSLSRSASYETT